MIYYRFFIIAFLTVIVNTIHAELPFIYLKDLYNKVSKDYKHLSPVNGFHWWKLGIIENLYRFGNPDDDTVKLIRELFYLQPWDNITFDITTLDSKPAKYLTSRTIGKILAFFESQSPAEFTEKTEKEFKESLKQTIKDDLQFSSLIAQAQKKKEQHELQLVQLPQRLSEIDAELKRLAKSKQQTEKFLRYKQKNLEEMTRSGASADKIANLTESIKSDQNILDSINQKINQFTGYKQKFGELGQMRKKMTQEIAKENLTEKSLDRFIDHLVGCFKESLDSPQQRYPRFTFHQIMLGFLWKRVQKKHDFADYFASFLKNNIPIVAETDLLSGTLPEWLSESNIYTKDDFYHYKDQFPQSNLVFLLQNYELTSFLLYGYKVLGDFILPPIIASIANTKYKQYVFPDCVESSIRNFINILIFDANRDILDIDLIPKTSTHDQLPLRLAQSLLNFYKKNNKIETIESDILHNEWANVVSELSDVDYRIDKICNIKSGFNNSFKVINHLFFGNRAEFDALSNNQKLDLLCQRLNTETLNITWQSDETIDSDDEVIIEFTIRKNGNMEQFTWNIVSDHSLIKTRELLKQEFEKINATLLAAFNQDPEIFQITNLFGWVIQPKTIKRIVQKSLANRQTILGLKILYNSQRLDNNEVKMQLLSILLPQTHQTNEFDSLIDRLITSVPQDFHFQLELLQLLLDSSAEYYRFIPQILEKEIDERNKTSLIKKIIAHPTAVHNKFLITLISNTISQITDDFNVNFIIATIIYSKNRNFDFFIIENFYRIFFKNAQDVFIQALKIVLEQEIISATLKHLIQEKLHQIAEDVNVRPSIIQELLELLFMYHKKLEITDIIRTLIERKQHMQNRTELYLSNRRIAQLILEHRYEELYETAVSILQNIDLLDQWVFIDIFLFKYFKPTELPLQFESFIENAIINSNEKEFLKGLTVLLEHNAKQFYPSISEKISAIADPSTLQSIIDNIQERLQKELSVGIEQLYTTALKRQQELS